MAKKVSDIDPMRLEQLNTGKSETATLTECLAVDFSTLLGKSFPKLSKKSISRMSAASHCGITQRMALAAELLYEHLGETALEQLSAHTSDTVRGWSCYILGNTLDIPLDKRLRAIRPLANDAHFGVREWSWLAMRPHIAAHLSEAIAILAAWTGDSSERLRRFASEATRPRGVWCAHLTDLKHHPETALPILEPLKSDSSIYVRNSVGNWLNDAAKSQPKWVKELCDRWKTESDNSSTAYICSRALRSI